MEQEKRLGPMTYRHIDGYLCPVRPEDGDPWLLKFPDRDVYWVPVFSSVEKLEEAMADLKVPVGGYKIVRIHDGRSFVSSVVSFGYRVAADPYAMRSLNVSRWTEILPEECAS